MHRPSYRHQILPHASSPCPCSAWKWNGSGMDVDHRGPLICSLFFSCAQTAIPGLVSFIGSQRLASRRSRLLARWGLAFHTCVGFPEGVHELLPSSGPSATQIHNVRSAILRRERQQLQRLQGLQSTRSKLNTISGPLLFSPRVSG